MQTKERVSTKGDSLGAFAYLSLNSAVTKSKQEDAFEVHWRQIHVFKVMQDGGLSEYCLHFCLGL
jgi:hypothetical protein